MAAIGADAGPVLLCYDGSGPAKAALAEAGRLLAPASALVVHVWLPISRILLWSPVLPSPGPLAEAAADLDEAWRGGAQRILDEGVTLAHDAGFDARPLLVDSRHGAWRTIVQIADERDARLIVAGSHGMAPITSRLLGSVAAGIVHHARRPVLVVPAQRLERRVSEQSTEAAQRGRSDDELERDPGRPDDDAEHRDRDILEQHPE